MPISVAYRSGRQRNDLRLHAAPRGGQLRFQGQGWFRQAGHLAGGRGRQGKRGRETALVKQSPGTIGYVEYGYATHTGLSFATLQNKSGAFVKATAESGAATLASVELPANLRIWPVDPTGADNYPITTFTWIVVDKTFADKAKWAALKDWLTYDLTEGQKDADELGYIALPAPVIEKVKAALETVQ